eukprot:Lankesteria_metandrocarpae@DN5475_c2_g1_i5.p1
MNNSSKCNFTPWFSPPNTSLRTGDTCSHGSTAEDSSTYYLGGCSRRGTSTLFSVTCILLCIFISLLNCRTGQCNSIALGAIQNDVADYPKTPFSKNTIINELYDPTITAVEVNEFRSEVYCDDGLGPDWDDLTDDDCNECTADSNTGDCENDFFTGVVCTCIEGYINRESDQMCIWDACRNLQCPYGDGYVGTCIMKDDEALCVCTESYYNNPDAPLECLLEPIEVEKSDDWEDDDECNGCTADSNTGDCENDFFTGVVCTCIEGYINRESDQTCILIDETQKPTPPPTGESTTDGEDIPPTLGSTVEPPTVGSTVEPPT